MRLVPFAAIFLAAAFAGNAKAADPVLLAGSRGGWIEAVSLDTLNTVYRVRVPGMTNSVGSDDTGRWLFLSAPRSAGQGCCALFALNTQSLQLSALIYPAQSIAVTAGRLFTQRGSTGIDVFDLQSLNRLPTIRAPGVYRLRPAPDDRLIVGMANWPEPSLDLFDPVQGLLLDHQPVPEASSVSGAWLDQRYFILATKSGQATLRAVNISSGKFGTPALSPPLGSFAACEPAAYDMVSSGSKLVIYTQLGLTSDGKCSASSGGFVFYDLATGAVSDRFASDIRFRQLIGGPDGLYLYGLDIGSPAAWQRVRIVKIDAKSGEVIAEKNLESAVWYVSMGALSPEMQGRLDLSATLPAN